MKNGATKSINITPDKIDQNGLLSQFATSLAYLDIHLHYNEQINGYQGFKILVSHIYNVKTIQSNYHFTRFINIINQYETGKGPQDKIVNYMMLLQQQIYWGTTALLV